MVNLARSAALAYAITTLISSVSAKVQLSLILLYLNQEIKRIITIDQTLCKMLTLSSVRVNWDIQFSPSWQDQSDWFFLFFNVTQTRLVFDDFGITKTIWKRFSVNTSKPHRFRWSMWNRVLVNAAWDTLYQSALQLCVDTSLDPSFSNFTLLDENSAKLQNTRTFV